ncbi:hypothetical protein [Crocosphaera chwakensis]|uniref:Uncharacterized protein n=1 Tax=Crocosphaera chwakensis CCY0110 TaxID=391612 RepID=A3IZY8_9CHRO|nr:hypothetical protein [Crocosphaera chwakensis]EAZ87958.1 hypothetical protein CY0110_02854 [Crocosphaera chwakensis CCY0110]
MFDPISIGEFSRNNCVSICAFLIPANLLGTLLTLIFLVIKPSSVKLLTSVTVATLLGIILCLHVATWWIIGVIQVPTFILLSLATVCISLNLWAITESKKEEPWLSKIVKHTIKVRFSS